MSTAAAAAGTQTPATHSGRSSTSSPALFTPLLDFMLLGGGSLFVILAIVLFLPKEWDKTLAFIMMIVAHFINHPHFAHSYQIFYDGFQYKAFGGHYSAKLRARYVVAGIIVPIVLVVFFTSCMIFKKPLLLGWGLSAMAFFVGWHYVKQGYGILMLQSAITGRFFNDTEKKAFLANAYATWILSWILANGAAREYKLYGVEFFAVPVPEAIVHAAMATAAFTLAAIVALMVRRQLNGKFLPWTGLMAYAVAIYPWLLLSRGLAAAALVVPAAHSLQYLTVVWRYQLNRENAEAIMDGGDPKLFGRELKVSKAKFGFANFITKGAIFGFLGFWVLPILLNLFVPFDHAMFGSAVFLAIFWMFINIHHYFLDSVMWRRENADMKKYLFVAPPKATA